MPEEVQTFSKIQLLDGTVAEVRDNTKQEAPATAGQAGQVLGLDENGDPAWLDSAGSVIPVFSMGQDGYECDMTFAEVYAAIQGNECTACVVQAVPGAIVTLQLYMASPEVIAFCVTTSSDTGNITSVILSFTDDENVKFEAYKDDVEVASIAETQTIIDEWEDEEMVIEMTYVYDSGATYVCSFVSSLDADDIIAAYTAGKNVVLHLPEVSAEEKHGYNVTNNVYITLIGYQPDDETYLFNTSDGYMLSAGEDEKLHLNLYFD